MSDVRSASRTLCWLHRRLILHLHGHCCPPSQPRMETRSCGVRALKGTLNTGASQKGRASVGASGKIPRIRITRTMHVGNRTAHANCRHLLLKCRDCHQTRWQVVAWGYRRVHWTTLTLRVCSGELPDDIKVINVFLNRPLDACADGASGPMVTIFVPDRATAKWKLKNNRPALCRPVAPRRASCLRFQSAGFLWQHLQTHVHLHSCSTLQTCHFWREERCCRHRPSECRAGGIRRQCQRQQLSRDTRRSGSRPLVLKHCPTNVADASASETWGWPTVRSSAAIDKFLLDVPGHCEMAWLCPGFRLQRLQPTFPIEDPGLHKNLQFLAWTREKCFGLRDPHLNGSDLLDPLLPEPPLLETVTPCLEYVPCLDGSTGNPRRTPPPRENRPTGGRRGGELLKGRMAGFKALGGAGPTITKTRNEKNVRRICKGCLVIGQPHTEELPRQMKEEQMRRNVHAQTRWSRHMNLQTLEELRAARLELMWTCDWCTLANDRWSRAATITWCADWTCVTSSMNIPQMYSWMIAREITLTKWQESHSCEMLWPKHVRKRWHGTKSSKPMKRWRTKHVCQELDANQSLLSMARHQQRWQWTCGSTKPIGRTWNQTERGRHLLRRNTTISTRTVRVEQSRHIVQHG